MEMQAASTEPDEGLVFQAVVRPHRSLSTRGVLVVAGCMLAGSATVTSLMFLLGAWPVVGFNGADITLAIFLLWLNMRAARAREVLALSDSGMQITRTDAAGRQTRFNLPSYWLRVDLQERAGTVPKLLLRAGNRRVEVARQLGEAEKRDLAAALTRALHSWRNPRFDNPQLRD